MVNPNLTVPAEPDLFLEFLLRCALTAPGASSSPTAGRILARLLVVGAIEGGDELVTPYLVPVPGEDASFEVRAYRPGNLDPTEVRAGLGAAAALRIALRAARDGDDGLEVVSQTRAGLERCVLVRDSTGDFEFRFASGETLNGEPEDCAAARRAWAVTLADWRAWVAGEHPEDELGRSRPEGIGLVSAESPPAPAAPAPAAPA
ncbi:MAG: hypothetical protein M3083_12495, partial [Actinomycetota bacterium]|nr:hypothetical protein [Actinomycetota bacterium]